MDIKFFKTPVSEHTEIAIGNNCFILFTNVVTKSGNFLMSNNGTNESYIGNIKITTIIQFVAGGVRKAVDTSNNCHVANWGDRGFFNEYEKEIKHMHESAKAYLESINISLSKGDIDVFSEFLNSEEFKGVVAQLETV